MNTEDKSTAAVAGPALSEELGPLAGATEGAMRNFATACAFRDLDARLSAAEDMRKAIRAEVAAERERIRARLLAMDDAVSGRHNYYAHAAVVLFGPNKELTGRPPE